MAYKQQRPTIKIGKISRAVILPKPWLDYHGEKAKLLTLLGDAILIIAPQGYEKKAQELSEAMDEVMLISYCKATASLRMASLAGRPRGERPMSVWGLKVSGKRIAVIEASGETLL